MTRQPRAAVDEPPNRRSGRVLADLTPADARRTLDLWVVAIVVAYAVAAVVGLPLYGDGAYYWLKVAGDETFVVPNLRIGAVLPQLPGMAAAQITDDPVLLRHAFSLGYVAVPAGSLLACWLLVRRVAPALLLFPLLWLTAHQINFSAVSELLTSAHLAWPLVLGAALWPASRGVRVYGWLLGALFIVLHPMAFVPALGLAVLAAWLGWRAPLWAHALAAEAQPGSRVPALRWAWLELSAWLTLTGLLRLGWTLVGANRYERSNLSGDGIAHYLLPATPAQGLLLAVVLAVAALGALAVVRGPANGGAAVMRSAVHAQTVLAVALVSVALWIGGELLFGDGIKLKAALTYLLGLLLMALAAVCARVLQWRAAAADTGDTPARVPTHWLAAPAAAMLVLLTAKCSAWWLATHELGRMVAETEQPCVVRTLEQPPSLQWRWMRVLDEWPVGINALAFRPRAPAAPEVSLLLPNDGCERLLATGEARLQSWIIRPWSQLNARFGPLRRLPGWE